MSEEVKKYIRKCYRTTAFRRIQSNKQKQLSNLRHDAWQLHPRFAPCFGISPRKKKQIYLKNDDVKTILFGSKDSWDKFLRNYSKKFILNEKITNKEQNLFD